MGITDFGPISNGTVTIKPLTILLGPNGSGKSHVATLVYTIIKAESTRLHDIPGTYEQDPLLDVFDDQTEHILEQYTTGLDHILDSDTYKILIERKVNVFSTMLSNSLLAEHKKLVRLGKKQFKLDITSKVIDGEIQYTADGIKFEERDARSIKFIFKKRRRLPSVRANGNVLEISIPSAGIVDKQELRRDISFSLRYVFNSLSTMRAIYFPSERGGLTMAQRSLTLHYYNLRGGPIVSSPDPNLAIVATDFLGQLLTPTKRTGKFANLATDFEKAAMKGTINVKGGLNNVLEIVFTQHNEEFPLNASASSIKDMAVFLLYLKYAAKLHDTIILEEPETCLHPTNQILLARLLARLVNNNFNIVVTTHSPFFVDQLSNCVVAGENHKNKSAQIPDDEKLSKDDVAVSCFVPDDGGYKITSLDVSDEGIPEHEFTRVYDQLYNERLEMEQD